MKRLAVAEAACSAVACFLGVLPALDAYRVQGGATLLALAVAAPTCIVFVAVRVWRLTPVASYAASVTALAALLFASDGFHPVTIARQLANGPNRLLTETLPLGGPRVTLTTLVVVAWVSSAATSELLGRSADRAGASNGAGGALAIPAGLYALCYAAGSSAPRRDKLGGPLLLAALAALALIRYRGGESELLFARDEAAAGRRRTLRTVGGAATAAAAVTVLAYVVVPILPSMSSTPASLHRAPPTSLAAVVDPLDTLATLRDSDPHAPPQKLFSVTFTAATTGYLAVAVLDDYDGYLWKFDSTFEPTGGRIPQAGVPQAGGGAGIGNRSVGQAITLTRLMPEPLLPALDRPARVSGTAVAADPATGMLLPEGHPALPLRYTVVSAVPDLTLSEVPPADGVSPAAGSLAADVALPPNSSADLATALRFVADLTGERPAPSLAFLESVQSAFQAHERRIDPSIVAHSTVPAATSFGGTSLSEVINAVTVERAATPEQFATIFVMIARYLGLPARVVTGFRVPASSLGTTVPRGNYTVTDRQAWAWAEVPVAGIGWVVSDPTPDARVAVNAPPPQQVQAPATTTPPRQANAVPLSGGHALAAPAKVAVPRSHAVPWWVIALLAGAAVLLAAASAGPGQAAARRRWRRRARRRSDAEGLAVGAWLELIDGLQQAGMLVTPGVTSTEISREASIHFHPDVETPVREVGALADRAVFASPGAISVSEARDAWDIQRQTRVVALATLDRRQRFRSWLTVGQGPRQPGPN